MFSQRELGNEFRDGATSGQASNVELRDFGDYTALIGYGHALYAIRDKETGNVTSFTGWIGYSQSTTQQFTTLEIRDYNVDRTVEDRPKTHESDRVHEDMGERDKATA